MKTIQTMPKTLLKIDLLKDGICSAELNCTEQIEKERITASILSLMDQDDEFAQLFINAVGIYCFQRKELANVNQKSMHSAKIKTQN